MDHRLTRFVIMLLPLGVFACTSKNKTADNPPPSVADAEARVLTYYADVKPILDSKCVSCHQAGGVAPFVLTDPTTVVRLQRSIVASTQQKTMPPWLADNSCRDYQGDRSLTEEQIKTLALWSSSGAKLGNPDEASSSPAIVGGLSRVDRELVPAVAYKPKDQGDDYRCFVMDWPETSTKFVTGFGVQPGRPEIVHHVIAYRVPANQLDAVQTLDDAEVGPGYSCFAGPLGSASSLPQLAQWAPGTVGRDLPMNTGLKIEPGSKIVMQVHYNMDHAPATADQSKILLKLDDKVEMEAFILPFTDPSWVRNRTMNIPAGEADVKHSFTAPLSFAAARATDGKIPAGSALKIYSSGLHMHLLGEKATLSLQHKDGSRSCLLNIPSWDFHWQGSYVFKDLVSAQPSDSLNIECHFNNSEAHQPMEHGEMKAPRDVNWGEGTEDEMCLGFVYVSL